MKYCRNLLVLLFLSCSSRTYFVHDDKNFAGSNSYAITAYVEEGDFKDDPDRLQVELYKANHQSDSSFNKIDLIVFFDSTEALKLENIYSNTRTFLLPRDWKKHDRLFVKISCERRFDSSIKYIMQKVTKKKFDPKLH